MQTKTKATPGGYKYIVVGREAFDENTFVIYDDVADADAARAKFERALKMDSGYLDSEHDVDIEGEFEFYIDFIFRVPVVDVFVCQDDYGSHKENKS